MYTYIHVYTQSQKVVLYKYILKTFLFFNVTSTIALGFQGLEKM